MYSAGATLKNTKILEILYKRRERERGKERKGEGERRRRGKRGIKKRVIPVSLHQLNKIVIFSTRSSNKWLY